MPSIIQLNFKPNFRMKFKLSHSRHKISFILKHKPQINKSYTLLGMPKAMHSHYNSSQSFSRNKTVTYPIKRAVYGH